MKKFIAIIILLFLILPIAISCKEDYTCAVYFTGIGCPHCSNSDPVLLLDMPQEHKNLIVIEYEIYQQEKNSLLIDQYHSKYGSDIGIPLIIFNKNKHFIGDKEILQNIDNTIKDLDGNYCPLVDGSLVDFNDLDITSLPGKPNIWTNNKILIHSKTDNRIGNIDAIHVNLSGKHVKFDNAIKINNWIFQWNGDDIYIDLDNCSSCIITKQEIYNENKLKPNYKCSVNNENKLFKELLTTENVASVLSKIDLECIYCIETYDDEQKYQVCDEKFTPLKIATLAIVDAINPCAFAVLMLMLITIISYNPEKKSNILTSGLSFIWSIFIIYFFYGLLIIGVFQFIQESLLFIKPILYKILGIIAMILGFLNIKDFISNKKGGFLTEMPLSFRPKVKKIISGITSTKGAFIIGAFVTIFLLPCTIGPYFIAGGILSENALIDAIPWLLIYNFIFILPMLSIILIIYIGFKTMKNVSGWKNKNVKYFHLIAGLIMLCLGIVMFFELF